MEQQNISLGNSAVSNQTVQQIQAKVKETLEIVMGDSSAEMLDEMSTIFLEDSLPLVEKMRSGLSSLDFQATRMAAHALKGSSATIGLEEFAHFCQAVETSSKNQEPDQLKIHVATIEEEYRRIEFALRAFLM